MGDQIARAGHVAGAVVLLGGCAYLLVCIAGMRRAALAGDAHGVRRRARHAGIADKCLPVGAALILFSGLYLTWRAQAWSVGWIQVSLGVMLVVVPVVPVLIARRIAAIRRAADGPSPQHVDVLCAAHDPLPWTGGALVSSLSVGVLYIMLSRPDAAGAVVAAATSLGIAGVIAAPVWVPRRAPAPAAETLRG